eukprot:6851826-Alexandrium_andersonii.AAC.1
MSTGRPWGRAICQPENPAGALAWEVRRALPFGMRRTAPPIACAGAKSRLLPPRPRSTGGAE